MTMTSFVGVRSESCCDSYGKGNERLAAGEHSANFLIDEILVDT